MPLLCINIPIEFDKCLHADKMFYDIPINEEYFLFINHDNKDNINYSFYLSYLQFNLHRIWMALRVKVGLIMLLTASWPDCDCDGNTIFV